MSKSSVRHKKEAPSTLRFAVVTISTSKYQQRKTGKNVEDESGKLIVDLLQQAGHRVVFRELIPDSLRKIRNILRRALRRQDVDAVVTTGGTGVTPKDVTIEAVKGLLEKELPGFGELLRKISYEKIGSAALMTRAVAGVSGGKAVFCLPGSPHAVEVGVKHLIIPEAPHVVKHAKE
ncbi:molybdenum cofactor biosynthesis protein B [Candidatus Hecatella orcuttiae]|uniref:MogA/MoaB family molybdenum cofactor biosynthesis protein n=1 Tax=Candidatus Hecatella orcuttiae TaxID=1935119 RepID=UPI002867B472|nr:molybdenum cofactor biosynthesis protein B [Candidatus Hecatella orcuttiae]